MSLQSVVRWLLPKADHFYDYLEGQANVAHEAAKQLLGLRNGEPLAAVRARVQELEHEGDKLFHELLDELAKTFVTSIDREDLQRLSAELDDILDRMNGATRAAGMMGVEKPTEPMTRQIELLVTCTEILKSTMPLLRKHDFAKITEAMVSIRKLEKDADVIYRAAVSELFMDDRVDAKKLLREREILKDLEEALDYCDRVAGTLANLAVKHA